MDGINKPNIPIWECGKEYQPGDIVQVDTPVFTKRGKQIIKFADGIQWMPLSRLKVALYRYVWDRHIVSWEKQIYQRK